MKIDGYELYGDNLINKINQCKTVEEIESLRCNECSKNGHWGWCDGDWIRCPWKERIKEILGRKESRFNSITEQMAL